MRFFSFLAVKGGNGQGYWYNGTPSGGFSQTGPTDNWPLGTGSGQVSALVPFGDIDGDGYADLLVRRGDGTMRAYLGNGRAAFPQSTNSVSLGTGWNVYNALASPGDVTGDRIPDLLGRDSSGQLWLFAGTGKGALAPRVLSGSGWTGYCTLIGAGDLTGDGIADLPAVDASGVLWRMNGNGHGGFAARVRVSSGWSQYNAIIGIGDLSNDGSNDLVARDKAGTLWLFAGNGHGGFGVRTRISSGWQAYRALF